VVGNATQVTTSAANMGEGGEDNGGGNGGTNTGETDPISTTATSSSPTPRSPPRDTIDSEKYFVLNYWVASDAPSTRKVSKDRDTQVQSPHC
jgi:hypothetical protein